MLDYLANLLFAYAPLMVAAVLVHWAMLRWLDRLGRINFSRDVMPVLRRSSIGCALYFGARLVAIAILVSAVLGAVRF